MYNFPQVNNNLDPVTIRLGIVTPMANEKESAIQFIKDVLQQCSTFNFKSISFYIIFDNVCTDGTMDMLKEEFKDNQEIKIIFAPENRNVVDAYFRGYREALSGQNDWILEIDAGFSHQPKDIPLFFEAMQQGYECAFGSRFIKGSVYKPNNLKSYVISKGGSILTNLLIGTHMLDMTSGFEIFSHSVLSSIIKRGIRSKGPFFQTEIKTYAHKYNFITIPIHYKDASHTISRSTLSDSFSCLWHLFRKRLANTL